ncbi:PREDICTED: mucin-5AC [Wasmannia auropunctata]|uniref:mucin-5AC n=1 Tax=Wasmannia auropunctata TaxID=64793 RepID=UPI0005EF6E2A|nr:PREDICTED: mucin-5AC [Wasmannia auropunctata]
MLRCRRGAASRGQVLLLRLLLVCALVIATHQEETARSWDKLSQLIPTNSVYEKQDRNASPSGNEADASLAHSLTENNVMDTSKSKGGGDHEEAMAAEKEEKEEEKEPKLTYDEEYEDEDKHEEEELEEEVVEEVEEEEKKDPPDTENGAMKKERSPPETGSKANIEAGDISRDGDYLEDLPTNQDDNTYYYYDEYENGNRSRYDAADGENLDYLDTESEEEDVTPGNSSGESDHGVLEKRDKEVSHESTVSNSSRIVEEEVGNPISSTELEKGSSMEGSDKTFTALDASGETEEPENVSAEVSSILIGGAVVSVVTTKSVVNGTISVPTTVSPATTEQVAPPPPSSSPSLIETDDTTEGQPEVTTEDSARILASVQTSRSVSGARFLPFPVIDRVEQVEAHGGSLESKKTSQPSSTESIIDKLDWAQSKLSSDLLPAAILSTGGFRNAGNTLQLDVLAERDRTTTTTATTTTSTTTRRSFTTTAKAPVISKFIPRRYNDKRQEHTSTTAAKPRFETVVDTLEGLLPRNYVSRGTTPSAVSKTNFRPFSKPTTTTEAAETKTSHTSTTPRTKSKASIAVQDISAFLPQGYKLKKEDAAVTESSLLSEILAKSKVDISSLLPPGYDKKKIEEESKSKDTTTTTTITTTTTAKSTGLSPEKITSSIQDLFTSSKIDISALLPKDYEQKKKDLAPESKATGDANSEQNTTVTERIDSESPTTKKAGGLKIVFPSRPGGRKPIHKITTPQTPRGDGSGTVTPKIQKGWPTRATTEFTGWPTPSTTPISIEKLLEAARTATVASVNISLIPSTNEISSTSSTSTTTTTPRPTTPGVCDDECEVAGTIRIIGNATWVPELFDRNTREWQELANHVEREINLIFSKSSVLKKWYKKIRIDSFSQGSILVDYFIELANVQQKVNTQELKVIFHDSLKTYNASRNETSTKVPLKMGIFTIDPKYTDFVVIPKLNMPQYIEKDDRLIPQWAIAVIVIGVGGLLFIIVFGVSVLVNRQSGSKLKPTMSAIYDEEVAKHTSSHRSSDYSKPVHTIWTDPDVSWNDKSFESNSNKILVDKSFQDKKYNMYDSWRSEWNGYYYNPSHTSSKYGYDSTTNLSSRHHPDYDTNF